MTGPVAGPSPGGAAAGTDPAVPAGGPVLAGGTPPARAAGQRPDRSEPDRSVPKPPEPKPPVLNIANVLTIIRLVLVPVFVGFLFAGPDTDGWRYAAFAAYAVAAVTDQIDGTIARRRGLITDFGILVDPIADKALTGAALVSLSLLDELPWAVTVLVAVREIGVTLLRLWVIRFGVIAASRGGKAKTLLLNISLGLYVLPLDGFAATGRAVILSCGVIVAMVTGADYVYRALALRRRAGDGTGASAAAGARPEETDAR
ncbi:MULTISPECIES: CDP-alcohol phosphatidyltransferase family protein [Parafrankia]|uniref:CDP-alcohol phosphatidyltransferase family protein n=1 Tax=Parafrankia TaxID=2994362 RepID=UPI000B849823|nr:CDP-alcohol phosphatidyltransferase family protein [Parafrankia sp. CH37]